MKAQINSLFSGVSCWGVWQCFSSYQLLFGWLSWATLFMIKFMGNNVNDLIAMMLPFWKVFFLIFDVLIFIFIFRMSHMLGSKGTKYILKTMCFGYGIPLLICLVMNIVEATADRCSPIQPNFGHKYDIWKYDLKIFKKYVFRSCLFYGKTSKFVWFLGPILLMLIINSIMFVYITYNIFKNQWVFISTLPLHNVSN